MKGFACLICRAITRKASQSSQLRLFICAMFVAIVLGCLLFAIVQSTDPTTNDACPIKLPVGDHAAKIYKENLKWQEPVTKADSSGVTFECKTGFLAQELTGDKQKFTCSKGKYNGKYDISDLLCKSEYHKHTHVKKINPADLKSAVLHCKGNNWELFEVLKDTKPLYRSCLDTKSMRTKFSYRLPNPEKPVLDKRVRGDVWGFDGYGENSEERRRLSQAYVKRTQQNRITKLFPNKYNQGKTYPYYFNRGHLVAFRDFNQDDDQKATVQYINAAPQWELLNEHSWSLVEIEVRNMLQKNPQDWEVHTGTYGSIQAVRPTGPVYISPVFDNQGRFIRGQLPVPLLFWKLAYNTKNIKESRAFIGINNPEIQSVKDITDNYKMCSSPIGKKGATYQGSEFFGFTYECPVEDFLRKLKEVEKVVI